MAYKTGVLSFFLFLNVIAFGQSPYEVTWKKEIPYLTAAAGTMGLATYFYVQPIIINADDYSASSSQNINYFDRVAIRLYSKKADRYSDVFWTGSHAFPLLFLGNKNTRSHFGQIMAMYGEASVINFGLTVATKYGIKRPRPYLYNEKTPDDWRLSNRLKTSFISGHTSITATNSFFAAKVFSDFFPESKWKPIVWASAALIPAVTGYLRVVSGRHYPTDVLGGYAVGAAIGVLVPHFHRHSNLKEKGITLQAGGNGVYFAWNFN